MLLFVIMFSVYVYREDIHYARIIWIFDEICRSHYCSQYIFFRMAVRNYLTSYQVRITYARILPNASIIGLRAPLTACFEQILIRLNNKFWIIITKRVVITRHFGPASEPFIHTQGDTSSVTNTKYILVLRVRLSPRKVVVLLDSQIFWIVPFRWKSCSLLMNWWVCRISRWAPYLAHSRSWEVMVIRAITRQRLATLKEIFAKRQKLDCKIRCGREIESNPCFTQNYFLTVTTMLSTTWLRYWTITKSANPIPRHTT